MAYGVRLRAKGDFACFSRPEMKVERVSYDAITPTAARGLLSAVYWKPAIRWIVTRIHVLSEIKSFSIRRNEVASTISPRTVQQAIQNGNVLQLVCDTDRMQRAALLLRDVDYVIEARFEETGLDASNPGKHLDQFNRRLREGRHFCQPYLGCREFPAALSPVDGAMPNSFYLGKPERDLGWMLHDIDFERDAQASFFQARMVEGVIEVPPPGSEEVRQ